MQMKNEDSCMNKYNNSREISEFSQELDHYWDQKLKKEALQVNITSKTEILFRGANFEF